MGPKGLVGFAERFRTANVRQDGQKASRDCRADENVAWKVVSLVDPKDLLVL
jgi:hypothetical protein